TMNKTGLEEFAEETGDTMRKAGKI
ncbi:hypothetical protein HLPCO_000557, partial [Haloplasma contractile SSD-17B]